MFDIKKFLIENKVILNEASCQGCGWNTEPDRTKYCKTCDPSGEREANRKKSDVKEGATGTTRKIELEAHKIEGAMRTLTSSLQKLESITERSISMDARQLQQQATALSKQVTKLVDRIASEGSER